MPEQPSQHALRVRPTVEIMLEATLTTALMDRDWRLARALADALDALERSRARHFEDSAADDPGLMARLAADDPTARYDPATGITTFDSTGTARTRRVVEACPVPRCTATSEDLPTHLADYHAAKRLDES
jgi:hypothetical protein